MNIAHENTHAVMKNIIVRNCVTNFAVTVQKLKKFY